mmetsp:Transcript_18491/g.25712  ORF Transcript_18491/g.25712 Transcript_18491/m.25712 type:complete len:477 (-) Transcript_18491:544-1974(-)|eukprot:CAMPEP_0184501392 /NCGR_PEP_ID=MMETSP0113_2-20130426/47508_1 /TAXON_ID=91329 /ORGANISM="Norrisiella sphaerica, Strain BC52" /LENGTH=476 /DNA_ID=CAMNT_0026890141 /DNA_START=176 /DNA_END=1606 /DNA_ORIENTATION=-
MTHLKAPVMNTDKEVNGAGIVAGMSKENKQTTPTRSFNYGWVVALAGFFIHLCLGTMYCWGSLTPYITSYLRKFDPSVQYKDTIIVFMLTPAAQALAMPVGGMIEKKVGPCYTALLGSSVMCVGVILSAWATTTFQLLILYCLVFGLGMGTAYMAPIVCGMKWMPKRKGIVSGIVVAGFGLGGAFFNVLGAYICNPENKQPTPYFEDDVADRVPTMFIVLGCIYAAMTTIGAFLLKNPTEEDLIALGVNGIVVSKYGSRANSKYGSDLENHEPQEHFAKDIDLVGFLCDLRGWLLWGMMMMTTMAGVLVIGTYKTYGNEHSLSDFHLTIIGAICLAFNGGGRLMWGFLADLIGYKNCMMVCFSIQAIVIWCLVPSVHSPFLYCVVVCATVVCYGANFPLYPTATAEIFGTKYVGSNYGVVFSGFACAGILLKLGLGSSFLRFETLVMMTGITSAVAAIAVLVLTSESLNKRMAKKV